MRHSDPFDVARKAFESCGVQEDFCPFSREKSPNLVHPPVSLNTDYEYPVTVVPHIAFYSDESLEADRISVQPFSGDNDEETRSSLRSCGSFSENCSKSSASFIRFIKKVIQPTGWKTPVETTPTASQISSPASVKSDDDTLSDVEAPDRPKFSPIEEDYVEISSDSESSNKNINNDNDEDNQIQQKQQKLAKILGRIHAIKTHENEEREIVTKMPKMISDETLMISVDALRDDGRILKHFNIPIDLPSLQPLSRRQDSSRIRELPLKKRYHRSHEPEEKSLKMRRMSRKNILKGILQETKMKAKRVPMRREIVCEDAPLDLSRMSHREAPHTSPEASRIPPPAVPQPILHPIPLRYLVHPVRHANEPPQVSRYYPEVPRRHLPPYNYPHMLIDHNYVSRPMPLYPIPARYHERCPEAPLPPRKSYQIPQNPYRTQQISYPQYPPDQHHYLPYPPMVSRPVAVEKPRSDQLITYAFHPPQYIPQNSYVTHTVPQFHPPAPPPRPNPPVVQEISSHPKPVKVPSERHHIRNLLLENGTLGRVQPAKPNFSDEIPIFRVRNPAYRGVFPTHHEPPPNAIYYSHATQ